MTTRIQAIVAVTIMALVTALLIWPGEGAIASPTGYEVAPEFTAFYERSGGLPVFGYAISEPHLDEGRLVQYFERQRFELHPELAGTPYEILLGRIGASEALDRGFAEHPAFQPETRDGPDSRSCTFFDTTGFWVCNGFREYWSSQGLEFGDDDVTYRESLALFGYPQSREFVDPDTGLTAQYFERARFEFHPEHAGTPYAVLLGHLGKIELEKSTVVRGNSGRIPPGQVSPPTEPAPTPTPTPTPEPAPEPPPAQPPQPDPAQSIQSMVDAAASGSVVTVPAGIYRESVRINKPITLQAQSGAEIRGSDVWSGWMQSGSVWVSTNTVPQFANSHGQCESSAPLCRRQEQVFIDGQQLTQVGSNPQNGQFAVDGQRRIVIGQSPDGRTVEVSIRESWIVGQSANVTIDGFTMKHAANQAQAGAMSNRGFDSWTIRNNTLSHAHGPNVTLDLASNLNLINNDISFSGHIGVRGGGDWFGSSQVPARNITVRGNRIYNNNTAGYSDLWEAGGLKLIYTHGAEISDNVVYNNLGPGLWCDIDCENVTIRANRVYRNHAAGILYELSRAGQIVDNISYENGMDLNSWHWGGSAGILIQNSSDTVVQGNVVAWNGDGIAVRSEKRGLPRWDAVVNNVVRGNDIIMINRGGDEIVMGWLENWSGVLYAPASNNRGENNRYYHANPNQASWAPLRWSWPDGFYSWGQLSGFNTTPGENNGTYLSQADVNQILSASGVPTSPGQ